RRAGGRRRLVELRGHGDEVLRSVAPLEVASAARRKPQAGERQGSQRHAGCVSWRGRRPSTVRLRWNFISSSGGGVAGSRSLTARSVSIETVRPTTLVQRSRASTLAGTSLRMSPCAWPSLMLLMPKERIAPRLPWYSAK